MLNIMEVRETNQMIEQEKLDVRTITMGISLLDCAADSVDKVCDNIYDKITTYAKDLVATGEAIERDYGIPIVNKRITVTPISLVGASSCKSEDDFVKIAHALDRAAKKVGVDLIGGYSALVSKSMTPAEELLIRSLPKALSETDIVCSSVNVGSTKTGIDMNAVELLGHIIKDIAARTADNDSYGCVKFVAFCNVPDDNPFMAGGFHGVTEGDAVINVGVSGPGVVSRALDAAVGRDFEFLCETIKRTAFKITRRPARGTGGLAPPRHPVRHHRPVAGSDARGRRFGRRSAGEDRPGAGRRSRHHGGVGNAQRPGQEGRHHGVELRRWSVRRVHPRLRGQEHDRRGGIRLPDAGEAGGHDLRVLGRP